MEKQVIGSVTASVKLDTAAADDFAYLKKTFENASLQLATFTITEKGYSLKGADGHFAKAVSEDMAKRYSLITTIIISEIMNIIRNFLKKAMLIYLRNIQ